MTGHPCTSFQMLLSSSELRSSSWLKGLQWGKTAQVLLMHLLIFGSFDPISLGERKLRLGKRIGFKSFFLTDAALRPPWADDTWYGRHLTLASC